MPAAQALIMRDVDVTRYCPSVIQAHPEGLVYHQVPNHIILVTWGERITERCPGETKESELSAGTYQVEWEGECFLTTDLWTIAGVITKELRKVVHYGWKSWNLTDFNLPSVIRRINSTMSLLPSQLSDPKIIKLHVPFVNMSDHNSNVNHDYLWTLFLLLVVAVVVAIIVYKKCNCKKPTGQAASKSDDSEQVQTPRPTVSEEVVPPQPFVFKISNDAESSIWNNHDYLVFRIL